MYTPSKELCEPFELTAQTIRGLADIVIKRQPEGAGNEFAPIFRYKRLDNYERETNTIDDLLNENNRGDTRIIFIQISTDKYNIADKIGLSECGLHYNIEFSSAENDDQILGLSMFTSISYGVKGANEDSAQLLFNEIDKYIANAIIMHKQKKSLKLIKYIFSPYSLLGIESVMLFVPTAVFLLSMRNNNKEAIIEAALLSDSITDKLNALLQLNYVNSVSPLSNPYKIVSFLLLLALFPVFSLVTQNDKVKKKLCYYYPFVFNFGISPEDYKTRLHGFKTILGFLGAIIVGVLGNFIYSFFISFK